MSKTIKRYNETTGEWEALITPDVSLNQTFEDGEKILDSNISITNENYASGDLENPNTLDDTLTVISDDISKLQRNVSWLAKHGTGGGGGGGFIQTYGIEVTYKNGGETVPIERGQSIYTENGRVAVTFTITGGSPGDFCTYTYSYGSTKFTEEIEVDKEKTFIVEFEKSASVRIIATNPYGASISPFDFKAYISALSLRFNAEAAGTSYDGGSNILNISKDARMGTIPVLVTNGLGSGSTIEYTLTSLEDEGRKVIFSEPCNTESEHPSGIIDLWELTPPIQRVPGKVFSLIVSAIARIGNAETPISKFNIRVKIIDPSSLSITMSVNGYYDPDEPIDVEMGTSLNVAFRASGPNIISAVYYAGKIERENGEVAKIYGKYYDENLKDVDASSPADNDRTIRNTTTLPQPPYAIVDSIYAENEIITLTLKAWSLDTNLSAETSQRIKVVAASDYFPRQYGKRYNLSDEKKDTLFASWNSSTNPEVSDNFVWYSRIKGYAPAKINELYKDITIAANVINKNGFSGIVPSPTRMRLQNSAYLKISVPQEYRSELDAMSSGPTEQLSNYDGYTISLTYAADDTPLTDRVVFLWGTNQIDGATLARGIKITNSAIYWNISNNTSLNCKIAGGEKNTVDFVYDRVNSLAKIYINGVLNNARKVTGTINSYENDIYIATNFHNGATGNTCDMFLYEFSIYTQVLSDTQLVVNGKNARVESRDAERAEYNNWKVKNLLFLDEDAGEVSSMFDSEEFTYEYITGQIAPNSDIPTMALSFNSTSQSEVKGFTENYFYASYNDKSQIIPYATSSSFYYDPSTKRTIDNIVWNVELQGTSTLSYRVKNLEIYTTETVIIDGVDMPVLFQPKENWFPEKQFTLKADVVDSAHANNTVIGQWVNNASTCPILDMTPPMIQLASHRPADTDENGVQLKNEYDEDSYNTNVTIKHTTEGFPILLFISFAGKSNYIFAGIYSFNLGRYSYYNLGLKFLESFSRYKDRADMATSACPRIIKRYKETRTLGTINVENVYSYEFDNLGSDPDPLHPVWTQFGVSVDDYALLDAYGEFKYGAVTPEIKASLSSLMESVATCPIPTMQSIYGNIYNHTLDNTGAIISTHGNAPIAQSRESYALVDTKLHLKNAAAYFVIANAFGMTDSLGKNMTLRTWDGVKWYTCFYDMDTALGLDNVGDESIPTNAALDFVYYSFGEGGTQQGIRIRRRSDAVYVNEEGEEVPSDYPDKIIRYTPTYAAYKSKLWALLGETAFLYDCGAGDIFTDKDVTDSPYIRLWLALRNSSLSKAEKFSQIVKEKVATCGELLYDRDYDSKYIKDDRTTTFLHGTRVEYIKKWLRDHIYFLDGLFDAKDLSTAYQDYSGIEDSPYYKDHISFKGFNKPSGGPFNVKLISTTPTFLFIGTTNASLKYYLEEAGKEYTFLVNASTNVNSRLDIYASSLLTKIDGIGNVFEGITNSSSDDCLKALMSFNTPSAVFATGAFDGFKEYLDVDHGGQLESIYIQNSRFNQSDEQMDLGGLTKVLRINVSNTNLASLILPDSSLDSLNVSNSQIATLHLEGQNKLTAISTDGCSRLMEFDVINCEKIATLNVSEKNNLQGVEFGENASLTSITISTCPSLTGVTIYTNPNLETLTISNCTNLTSINVYNNKKLKKLSISGCAAQGLRISVTGGALEEVEFDGVMCDNIVTLPAKADMANVEKFHLKNCYSFSGIKYGTEDIEMYDEDDYVLDLSAMPRVNGRNLVINNLRVKYIRVSNDENNPLQVYNTTFENCASLVKVFGHMELMEAAFNGKPNFYINHEEGFAPTTYPEELTFDDIKTAGSLSELFSDSVYNYQGVYPEFKTGDEYYTNIKINSGATNLNGWFNRTNCDINDVYYVLQMCHTGITSLNSAFSNCGNVTLGEEEWFDINMFAKCENVADINNLFQGCHINGLILPTAFEPLIANLTQFNEVFSGNYKIRAITNDGTFFPAGNNIEMISGFNPAAVDGYFVDTFLLNTLAKLKSIKNSFNDCSIDFSSGIFDSTELFKENVELLSIENSFRRLDGVGSLKNIFGGDYPEDTEHYPRQLSSVTNSFTFASGSHGSDYPLYEGDDGEGVLLPLGNSLFRCVPNLVYLTGSYPGQNATNAEYAQFNFETDSFTGPGLLKYIDNIHVELGEEGQYVKESDADADGFPHGILSGLTSLKEIPGLFNGARNFGTITDGVNILEGMFQDCESLENISKFFKNLDSSVTCTLTSKEFKNCKLVNVDNIFENVHIVGQIPFGLFYQATIEEYDDNTFYEKENPTIEHMSYIFNGISKYTGMTSYSASTADMIMDNPDYTREAAAGTKNSFKKIWNLYSYDGDPDGFEAKMNALTASTPDDLYTGENPFAQYISNDKDNLIDFNEEIESFQDTIGYRYSASYDDLRVFAKSNYFCPPDILKYCKNANTTNITGVLANSSGEYSNREMHGVYGRMPEMILHPLTNVVSLSYVFQGNKSIFPNAWRKTAGSNKHLGTEYPANLFSGLSVQEINGIFDGTRMWPYTIIPTELFTPVAGILRYATNIWCNAVWVVDSLNNGRLPATLFRDCSMLVSVAGMFSNSYNYSIPFMPSGLFSAVYNSRIRNCSNFLQWANATHGVLPEFWDFPLLPPTNPSGEAKGAFVGVNPSYIENYTDISEHQRYPSIDANPYLNN